MRSKGDFRRFNPNPNLLPLQSIEQSFAVPFVVTTDLRPPVSLSSSPRLFSRPRFHSSIEALPLTVDCSKDGNLDRFFKDRIESFRLSKLFAISVSIGLFLVFSFFIFKFGTKMTFVELYRERSYVLKLQDS